MNINLESEEPTLPARLDSIWISEIPKFEKALAEVENLNSNDALILGAWAFGAANLPYFGNVSISDSSHAFIDDTWGNRVFSVDIIRPEDANVYTDSLTINQRNTVAANLLQPSLNTKEKCPNAPNLLTALQLIRDHIDSTYFLPMEIRKKRWVEFSDLAQIPPAMFGKLVSWYPQIESFVRVKSHTEKT